MSFEIKGFAKDTKKPAPQKAHKIFQSAVDEDDEPKTQKTSAKALPFLIAELAKTSQQKMLQEANKNILEDPDIYEYDSLHDNIAQARQVIAEQKKVKAPSRYIAAIAQTTEKRKVEQSIAYEAMAEKELKRENKQFSETGRYITKSYLKMKEAGQNFQLEDQKKEEYNKQHSIDQGSAVGLYKEMYNSDMFAGGHRPDLQKVMQDAKSGKLNQNLNQNKSASTKIDEASFDFNRPTAVEEEMQHEKSSNLDNREVPENKNKKAISRSRSRSKSPKASKIDLSKLQPTTITEKKIGKEDSRPVEEVKVVEKPLTKEEKLRLAKEKLQKRKQEQTN